jgi:phosphopantetheinyl transferase
VRSLRVLVLSSPRGLTAREKVMAQRAAARRALCELGLEDPLADKEGVPLPTLGKHWSVSHTEGASAAVLCEDRVGIDIEHEREISPRLLERFLGADEPALAPLVAWTAKESVLKKTQVGLAGLPECRIFAQPAPDTLEVEFRHSRHRVVLVRHELWYCALTCDASDWQVEWEWRA